MVREKLNQFAVWLYKKTRNKEDFKGSIPALMGKKVLKSDYIPQDTIMIGSKNYKGLQNHFLDKEITLKIK